MKIAHINFGSHRTHQLHRSPDPAYERDYQNLESEPDCKEGINHLQLGQVFEERLVDSLLRQLGGQDEHGLERELSQVRVGV